MKQQIKIVVAVIAIGAGTLFLAGCQEKVDVNVGKEGTSVNTSGTSVNSGSATGNSAVQTKAVKNNLVIVMDASGSMAEKVDGRAKMDIAKEAVYKLIDGLASDVNLGIVAYGHKGNSTQAQKTVSCQGIEEVYYIGGLDKASAKAQLANLQPTGWTPMASSLQKAQQMLANYSGQNNKILLASDGEETCGGNPIAQAKALQSAGAKVDVVGFDVAGAAETQLKDISINGNGSYFSVKNANDFNVTVGDYGVSVNAGGASVNVGNNGAVDIKTGDASVNVGSDGSTDIKAGDASVQVNDKGAKVNVPGVDINTGF